MAVTVTGFQGTVSDAVMAMMFPQLASVVEGAGDLLVTPVAGTRAVSIAPGAATAHFVRYSSDAAQQLNIPQPATGGRWYAVVLDREWSPTNQCTLALVDTGVTTDGSDATTIAALLTQGSSGGAPQTFPTWLKRSPGTAGSTAAGGHHQVLAFVHVRAATTSLQVVDVRFIAGSTLTVPNVHGLAWLAQIGGNGKGTRVAVGPHNLGEQVQSIEAVSNGFGAFLLTGFVFVGAPFTIGGGGQQLRAQINGYAVIGRVFGTNSAGGRPGLVVPDTQTGYEYQWAGTDWAYSSVTLLNPGENGSYVQEWGTGFATRLSRFGNRCTLVIHKRVINQPLPWSQIFMTLPSGFRPAPLQNVTFLVTMFDLTNGSGWAGQVGHAGFDSNGGIVINGTSGGATSARVGSGIFGTVTYDAAA